MRVEYSVWNTLRCECHKCSSYPGVFRELRRRCMPGAYCAKGASCVDVAKQGCYCPNCRVYRSYGLGDRYYCIRGRAKLLYPDKKEILVIAHEEKTPVGVAPK